MSIERNSILVQVRLNLKQVLGQIMVVGLDLHLSSMEIRDTDKVVQLHSRVWEVSHTEVEAQVKLIILMGVEVVRLWEVAKWAVVKWAVVRWVVVRWEEVRWEEVLWEEEKHMILMVVVVDNNQVLMPESLLSILTIQELLPDLALSNKWQKVKIQSFQQPPPSLVQ